MRKERWYKTETERGRSIMEIYPKDKNIARLIAK